MLTRDAIVASSPVILGSGEHHVLAVHGWFGSASGWGSPPEYLDGSAYTYVFMDLRGYGDRMAPAAAAAMLEDLADRALRSEFEPVFCLEAPEAVQVPRSLLRADGRSVYQRHGGVRYATRAQLAMEERLVAQAGAAAAPRLTRAGAARGLGAELARLEDTLAGRAQEIQDHHPERTQLTADQAAAVLSVLTDGKRVSVINPPAGSGKTRVMTEAARVWAAAGRPPAPSIHPGRWRRRAPPSSGCPTDG